MPILVKVEELQTGMVLAANVMNLYSVLLPHGRQLSEEDINSLRRRMPAAAVQIFDPLLDEVVDFDDDSQDREIAREVRKNIAQATRRVSTVVRSGVALNPEQLRGIQQVVNEMMSYLSENPVTMAIIEQSASWDDYLQEHAANVFYLSVLIGNTIKNYILKERERLSALKHISVSQGMNINPLAAAALFHDIGMAPLEHLYRKEEPLTDEEIVAVRAHPVRGADMLPEQFDPMARMVIRTHHENFDGSGYPEGISGQQLNIFARIIRVVDAYTAAISHHVYRRARSPVAVLHEMLYGPIRRLYDPVVLKVFASIIQPFPIGAKLKLADGRCAVVVRHNQRDNFNPHIVVAFDAFGDPISREELQKPFALKSNTRIRVAEFGEEDISFVNDLPEDPEQAPCPDEAVAEAETEDMLALVYP